MSVPHRHTWFNGRCFKCGVSRREIERTQDAERLERERKRWQKRKAEEVAK